MHDTEDYRTLTDELLEYFEFESGQWPTVSVWTEGHFRTGAVSDELYGILTALKELRDSDDE